MVQGKPALIDFETSVISKDAFLASDGASVVERPKTKPGFAQSLKRKLQGTNKAAQNCAKLLGEMTGGDGEDKLVLVIGGGRQSDAVQVLRSCPHLKLVVSDIYLTEYTLIAADGHQLPFEGEAFDAVWIEAVLEHVLDPNLVVSEIERVLKPNAFVFADSPFMQQVHEGAFDFTRYTVSGHRYLFSNFEMINAGSSAGAGTALIWSLRYFVRAITGSDRFGHLVGVMTFWLRLFDGVGDPNKHQDAASGVFFLGRKSERAAVGPTDVVGVYKGEK